MKLIIDIPETMIDWLKNGYPNEEDMDKLLDLVLNGTPLDKIRAEIDGIEEGISSYHNDRPWLFKDEVLEIIDRYRNEVSK